MKKLSILSIILLFSSCFLDNDCIVGSGQKITQEITLPNFTKFESFGANTITITQGTEQKVLVTGYPNIINKLKRTVINNNWEMGFVENECYRNADLSIQITMPFIEQADLNGTGKITIHNFEGNSQNLRLRLSGSGDFELHKNSGTENLTISIDGSGEVIGYGDFNNLKNLNLSINGSGKYDAFPIASENSSINILGSGFCNVFTRTTLDVEIEGEGTVNYKGNPTITKRITGSGKVIDKN